MNPPDRPPHPLVVDRESGVCHYVTDDDIRHYEAISMAYAQMIEDAHRTVLRAEELFGRLMRRTNG